MSDRSDYRDFNNRSTIECQLFEWESWDFAENGIYDFYDVVLKVDVGAFKAGRKFNHAIFDTVHSLVTFYDTADDERGHSYALYIRVGEAL